MGRLTPQQYLTIEDAAEFKSEYYNGEMFAMAGASANHNRLGYRFGGLIAAQLVERPCDAFGSDQRIHVPATGLYTYPDFTIVCGEARFSGNTLLNPTVIVEVLSPGTESYDRGRKFEHYRTIDSLREYVLVAQDRVCVDLYSRQPDNRWLLTSASSLADIIELSSIDCRLPIAELYSRVQFDAESPLHSSGPAPKISNSPGTPTRSVV